MKKVEFNEMRMVEAGEWITGEGFIMYQSDSKKTLAIIGKGTVIFEHNGYGFMYTPGMFLLNGGETNIPIYTPLYLVRFLIRTIFN